MQCTESIISDCQIEDSPVLASGLLRQEPPARSLAPTHLKAADDAGQPEPTYRSVSELVVPQVDRVRLPPRVVLAPRSRRNRMRVDDSMERPLHEPVEYMLLLPAVELVSAADVEPERPCKRVILRRLMPHAGDEVGVAAAEREDEAVRAADCVDEALLVGDTEGVGKAVTLLVPVSDEVDEDELVAEAV